MEEKQKPIKAAASKVKDIYNSYLRSDDATDVTPDDVVKATTSQDINQVHIHREDSASPESVVPDEASKHIASRDQTEAEDPTQSRVLAVEKERDELRDQLLRKIAEFENYRKRTEREKEQLSLRVSEKLFSKLVDILDDLNAALEAGKKSEDYTSMLSGLEMIYNKAHRVFEEHGVRPLLAEQNAPFNVDIHEALMHIPHPEIPEGQVVQQIQRGYMLFDRVLRHAKVVTSAGSGETESPSQ